MAKRAIQELSNGDTEATANVDTHTTGSEVSIGTAPRTTIKSGDDGPVASASGRSRTGSSPSTSSVAVAAIETPGGCKRLNSCSTSEPEGLEVLQLVAKGQALSSAVVVVEGVLHKMEEQARRLVVWGECLRNAATSFSDARNSRLATVSGVPVA